MKYLKNIEKLYDKIKNLSYNKKLDDVINRFSTGGKVERSVKKRVGDIANKNIEKRYSQANIYKAIEKFYKNITRD